jgi:branched-chain amino acid transport system substrate-binding protein
MNVTRRGFTKGALALGTGLTLGFPAVLRRAYAADPIKIGVPAVLSGGAAHYGLQDKRACEMFAKDIKAKGGILGRPVEFIFEDTTGDPATAVRKAQKLVEKDGVKYLTGIVLSSEALAVSAKCPEWKVLFMSSFTGVGSFTANKFNRYSFRPNTSGPMGARTVSLYMAEAPMKRFYGVGSDYAWGRDSIGSFDRQMTAAKKEVVGKDFPPIGTKDFGSYIAKIKQSKADACFTVLLGQDASIFFKQAEQFGLNKEVKLVTEIVELENLKVAGDAMLGVIGGSRYPFTLDTPKNRDWVKRFYDMHNVWPDMFDGETYQAMEWLTQAITTAGSDDVEKVIAALEDSTYEGPEGKRTMRKCDHQAVKASWMVEAVKDSRYPHLIPKILATYPGDRVTPKCLTEEFA